MHRNLALIGIISGACVAPVAIDAAPITYRFSGMGSTQPVTGFNAADPTDTVDGTFRFDDGLFSGAGFFQLPGNLDREFIEQESPDAFIEWTRMRAIGTSLFATESVVRTTGRPDLRFVDFTFGGVAFIFDNLEGSGGFVNISFGVPTLDDPFDLLGATGEFLHRTSGQRGSNVFQLYDVEIVEVIGAQAAPAPSVLVLIIAGLAALGGTSRRFSTGARRFASSPRDE